MKVCNISSSTGFFISHNVIRCANQAGYVRLRFNLKLNQVVKNPTLTQLNLPSGWNNQLNPVEPVKNKFGLVLGGVRLKLGVLA